VKCGVLFEVRAEFLSIIYTSIDFEGLIYNLCITVRCGMSRGLNTTFLGKEWLASFIV
jgi:hypothetical protein